MVQDGFEENSQADIYLSRKGLSIYDLTFITQLLQACPYLLSVYDRSYPGVGSFERNMARIEEVESLSSLGYSWI